MRFGAFFILARMSLLDLLGDYHSDNEEEETNVIQETMPDTIVTVVENVQQGEVLAVKNDVRHPFLASLPPPSSDPPNPALLDLLQQFQNQPNQSFDLIQVSSHATQ